MAHRGVLRHCLMAGLCSAAEETEELTASHNAEDDERSRLGGARHRCPYGAPATDAVVARTRNFGGQGSDPAYIPSSTATLHCERLWVEATS